MQYIYSLSINDISIVILCGILTGMSKSGISGANTISIPLLALIFGGKMSTGLILPMLIFADIFAITYYNRHAEWKYLIKIAPWVVVGIIIALAVGNHVPDNAFKQIMAVVILTSMGLLIVKEFKGSDFLVVHSLWYSIFIGVLAGFATMMGNAAGAVMALYLLSMDLPKNAFIGTRAWFFFLVNVFKIPFHIWGWKTITLQSFLFDVSMIPAIALGAFVGVKLVKIIPEKYYRVFIIAVTIVSSIWLFK